MTINNIYSTKAQETLKKIIDTDGNLALAGTPATIATTLNDEDIFYVKQDGGIKTLTWDKLKDLLT